MKIALVSVRSFDPCFPTGLLCLHAYLKANNPDHQIDIIEAAFENPLQRIQEGSYDLVGISAMTSDYETATVLAQGIRASLTIPIVIGGVHISKLPESFRDCFDVGVIGEGEEPLCELIALYEKTAKPIPEQFQAIAGLIFRDGKDLRQTPCKPLDLSNYPHLDYSAIHPSYFDKKASATFARFGIESYLLTSRGCPFKCVFCASSHFWGKVRYFPVNWVLGEIKALAARGVSLLNIGDDLFACNKKRLKAIADLIRADNLHQKIIFSCCGNTGVFDEETCVLLKSMNVKPIFFGFESGDELTLKYLKCDKNTIAENKQALLLCERFGFYSWGAVIIGSPGETLEQMENTIRFIDLAKKHGATRIGVAIMLPLPGTPVWETALKMGRVSLNMNFNALIWGSKEYNDGLMVEEALRPEFIKLRDRAIRRIHSFKWRKARLFFQASPWDTLMFAMRAPKGILLRMFRPEAP